MKLPVSILTAALLAASGPLLAQDKGQGGQHRRHVDCSKAKDPKLCEERVAKMKAAHQKAAKACESAAKGDARRDCMRKEMCAQSKDPAACEARAKEGAAKRAELRAKVREACKGKEGEALKACVREQRGKK